MCPTSLTLEYTSTQFDSAKANLEVFTKHVREYMAKQEEWEVFDPPTTQSALLNTCLPQLVSLAHWGVPITQAIASLLVAILEQTDDLKKSSAYKVLHLWPPHYRQYSTFVTKMSDAESEVLQIRDPKLKQGKTSKVPWEKALQVTAEEKGSHDKLAIRNNTIAEASSQAVDLATFNAKADINSALTVVE